VDEIEEKDALEDYKVSLGKQRLDQSNSRRFLYSDVEELITEGFLYNTININGSVIAFRTLPSDRTSLLKIRCESSRQKGDVLRWVLASSAWTINGYEVFQDRNAPFHLFSEFFQSLNYDCLRILSDVVWSLRRRLDSAMLIAESYCYEPYSRNMWYLQGKSSKSQEENSVRKIWEAHNISEDEFNSDMRSWEHTKAKVGSMTQKGAQHISKEIDRIKNKEEERRQAHIHKTLQKLLYGQDWDGKKKVVINLDGQEYIVEHMDSAITFEDLDLQMRRFVEGKKDAHDLVVEKYLNDIQERARKRQEEYELALSYAKKEGTQESGSYSSLSLVGYTPQQLEELGIRSNTTVKSDGGNSAIADHLFEKVVNQNIKAGWLNASNVPEEYGKDTGAATLQEKIAQRKPSLET
jgi:hypothetical protein